MTAIQNGALDGADNRESREGFGGPLDRSIENKRKRIRLSNFSIQALTHGYTHTHLYTQTHTPQTGNHGWPRDRRTDGRQWREKNHNETAKIASTMTRTQASSRISREGSRFALPGGAKKRKKRQRGSTNEIVIRMWRRARIIIKLFNGKQNEKP